MKTESNAELIDFIEIFVHYILENNYIDKHVAFLKVLYSVLNYVEY